jgi:isopenicillin N synthase-like dioxygenase
MSFVSAPKRHDVGSPRLFDAFPSERKAIAELPIIDLTPFFRGDSLADRNLIAAEIRDACINIGFFYIIGHNFSASEMQNSLAQGQRFFALPSDQKLKIAARNNPSNLGFIQIGGLNPTADALARADQKERLYFTRDLAIGETLDDLNPAGKSQFPSDQTLPGFAAALRLDTAKKVKLAKILCRAFSLSLNLPEDFLEDYHDRMSCIHTFNYYPPLEPELADKLWGFSPHTDYGSFTILNQDSSGGLQARNAADEWIDVPPIPGAFVINIGDLMARWTNDVYVSTLHRVMNRSRDPRLSLAFFATPNSRATIDVLPTCASDERPARYESIIAGEYIKKLVAAVYATGKPGISANTAARIRKPDGSS